MVEQKRLGDICTVVSGGTPTRSKAEYWNNGDIPWVKIGNIKSKYVTEADEFITKAGLEGSSAKMLPKGTILYTIFATLGEVGILDFDACTNQAIAGITIKKDNEILPDYLFYYLKSKKKYVDGIGRGVAQNNINLSILRDFRVPVPGMETQKGIVQALDSVCQIVSKRKQQLQKLDELVKARFVEMFGTICEPHYPVVEIEQLCSHIVDCPHETPTYEGELIHPAIRTSELKGASIDWSSMRYVSELEYQRRIKRIKPLPGDVVYAREGTYGDAAILPAGYEFCLGQRTMLFRASADVCMPEYLLHALISPDVKRQADELNVGSTVPHVNVKDAKRFKVMCPNLDIQQEFAAFVAQVDKSGAAVRKALEEAQLLFDSLMQKYFG